LADRLQALVEETDEEDEDEGEEEDEDDDLSDDKLWIEVFTGITVLTWDEKKGAFVDADGVIYHDATDEKI
jgi:U3 small nucleolar RNA-associated protein 14